MQLCGAPSIVLVSPSIKKEKKSFFTPPLMHKLYLSLVMFLTRFSTETLTMWAYLRVIAVGEEEGMQQTNGGEKRKQFREATRFLLLTALCGRHALTNYTTVSSWLVYWRSSLPLCFAFGSEAQGYTLRAYYISLLGDSVWSQSSSINLQGMRRYVWNIHK